MKINMQKAYTVIGFAGGLAIGFVVGDTISECAIQMKKLKVLDETMKAIEELMKKDFEVEV